MELADFLIGTAIAIIGLYLTHSLRRQQRLRVAEKRLDSYRDLWGLMAVARPTRLTEADRKGPLTRKEAKDLYDDTTEWYFGNGNGMLLMDPTKMLYLNAKKELDKYAHGEGDDWRTEGERVIRQLSLLRTQMKLDLDIYGHSYFDDELNDDDRAFLRKAGIDPARWGRPSRLQMLRARLRGTPAA
jgi:hypothetical protein